MSESAGGGLEDAEPRGRADEPHREGEPAPRSDDGEVAMSAQTPNTQFEFLSAASRTSCGFM